MFKKVGVDLIKKYDIQVPRYTSYPTAPHFNFEINKENYDNFLRDLSKNETLSLYLHVPFCQKMCWYCGCYTKLTQRYSVVEDYAFILAREIKIIADILQKKQKVLHIHFGGGSPTMLLANSFEYLMKIIKSEFNIDKKAQIAIEIDPRNVNEEKIASYAKMGVNRVSIGVQDFNKKVQKAINRVQTFDEVYQVINLCRKYKINDINLDLIYGLPLQTVEMIKTNIDYSLLLKPSRIALFSYAHVKWKKKHMRLIDENILPDFKTKIAMQKIATKKLQENGYAAIGIDHFADKNSDMYQDLKTKKLKRNFQGYTSDKAEYIIGFGASAISYLPFGYAQNILDLNDYKKSILNEELPILKGIIMNQDDKIRKKVIDEIMCYHKVNLEKIIKEFNLDSDYFSYELNLLQNLVKENLVQIKNSFLKINPNFLQISRIVASYFDKFFQASTHRHSSIA